MNSIKLDNTTVLVTGAAGFIGANLTKRLLSDFSNIKVIGIDNMNDYYDVSLKEFRLSEIDNISLKDRKSEFIFIKGRQGAYKSSI